MLTAKLINDSDSILAALPRFRELAKEAQSDLSFHQPDFPYLWWQHFRSEAGSDFGARRGRNFLGHRSFLDGMCLAVVEKNGEWVAAATMAHFRVDIKGRPGQLGVFAFCADSVQTFYQDVLVLPTERDASIQCLIEALAQEAKSKNEILFLGYVPEHSPNVPGLRQALQSHLTQGWAGGEATSQSRGGVYPWNLAGVIKGLGKIGEVLQKRGEDPLPLQALATKLESQTSALLLFKATRLELTQELASVSEKYAAAEDCAEGLADIADALAQHPIRYPYLPLPATEDAFFAGLSTSRRYYFKRYLRKYEQGGGGFEEIAPEDLRPEHVEEYLRLHAMRWGSDSISVNDLTLAFHRELSLALARAGSFRLFFATFEGKRIVAHACIDVAGRREYFFSGRDPAFEEMRAGKMLVLHTVLDAIRKGFRVYDFGYGGDDYKAEFTKTSQSVKNFFLAAQPELLALEGLFPKYECMELGS
jgi:hypothetical protein